VDITSTAFLFQEFLPTLVREVSFTVEPYYGTVYPIVEAAKLPTFIRTFLFVMFIVYVL